jgi:hypothetical protein
MGGDEFLSDAFIYGRRVSTRVILLALHPKLRLFHLRIVATRQNGDRNQDYRDGPDAANTVVDDGAKHWGRFGRAGGGASTSLARTWPKRISISKKFPEPLRRQGDVARRILNVAVTQISLDRSCVVTIVGELGAASMAQHVGVRLDAQIGRHGCPLDHAREAGRR